MLVGAVGSGVFTRLMGRLVIFEALQWALLQGNGRIAALSDSDRSTGHFNENDREECL